MIVAASCGDFGTSFSSTARKLPHSSSARRESRQSKPWNYPLLLPASSALAALIAGNAVVLKPSELRPAIAVRLGELLHEAGVPEAVMHVLPGDGATGAALSNAGVDKLFFTGSAATGRKVAMACAARLAPCGSSCVVSAPFDFCGPGAKLHTTDLHR